VPRIALQVESVVNSDYTNQVLDCKNCYLLTSAVGDEDCMFSYRILYSKNILDSYAVVKSENIYEGAMGRESANIFFSQGFADSESLYFCDESRGCQNCFMSSNLRRKSYVFRGEQLTREEYKRRLSSIDLGSYRAVENLRQEFAELTAKSLRPRGTFKNVINTTGNSIANAKDCKYCFHATDIENCHYSLFIDNAKDCMDMNNGGHIMELIYEMNTTGARAFNSKFCNDAWPEVMNLTYCDSCRSGAKDLFGCISVRGKQYCILNKEYSRQEYQNLIPKIIGHMNVLPYQDKKGRVYKYGEFFPSELSPFPYNDSMAQDFFQLTAAEAGIQGFRWNDQVEKNVAVVIPSHDLPDRIQDVAENIIDKIIGCEHEGRCNDRCTVGFRIVPSELRFYKRYNLPLPRLCPNCRHYERLKQRNPLKLWHRTCTCAGQKSENGVYHNTIAHFHKSGHCPNEFETSYAPDRKEIIYCEQCYNSEVV